jgi:hypothetical protein
MVSELNAQSCDSQSSFSGFPPTQITKSNFRFLPRFLLIRYLFHDLHSRFDWFEASDCLHYAVVVEAVPPVFGFTGILLS